MSIKNPNPKDAAASSETRLDISLFPGTALAAGSLAMIEGAKKYGAYNWRETPVKASVYIAAAFRHLMKYHSGEECDPTTGVHHLASVMANMAILIDADECGTLVDDRPLSVDIPWAHLQKIAAALPSGSPPNKPQLGGGWSGSGMAGYHPQMGMESLNPNPFDQFMKALEKVVLYTDRNGVPQYCRRKGAEDRRRVCERDKWGNSPRGVRTRTRLYGRRVTDVTDYTTLPTVKTEGLNFVPFDRLMYVSRNGELLDCRRKGEADRRKIRIPTSPARRRGRDHHEQCGRRATDVVSYMDLPMEGFND